MLSRSILLSAALAVSAVLAGCSPGGEYVQADRPSGVVDRGEANGRMFDFVSNMPDDDDWQVRIRDNSLWVAYASGSDEKQLGTVELTGAETIKIWDLIDAIDIPGRKKGKKDEDEGYVMLRLREPSGEDNHEMKAIFVSRATDDEAIRDLASYLLKLVKKYHKKDVEF